MGKQKKFKKIKLPPFIENFKDALVEKITGIFVILIFFVVSFFLVAAFIHGSDYFQLRSVETKGFSESSGSFSVNRDILKTYKNKNIFDINLKTIAKNMAARYPDSRYIAVKRYLPDSLIVTIDFRRPIALLGSSRMYPVDEEGHVLVNADPKILNELPEITGVDIKYDSNIPRKISSKNLKAALELFKEIKRSKFLAGYHLMRIDAGDINKLSFYINDGLEVRIGYENFKERLALLKNTLKDSRLMKDKIAYIDLRFEDVSIGAK